MAVRELGASGKKRSVNRARRQGRLMKIANVALDGSKDYGPGLCSWLRNARPDIVTLQKTGSNLPAAEVLRDAGYEGTCLGSGWPWLGVAVLSRSGLGRKALVRVCDLSGNEPPYLSARFLTVDIGGVRISSVYAPFGPRRLGKRDAIARRVAWLNRLREHVRDKGYHRRDSLLCGDFNVKADGPPYGELFSEEERVALEELRGCGFVDAYRTMHPNPGERPGCTRGYSKTSPEGTSRLHLVLASEGLARRLRSACVDIESKPWPRKDAPPLIVSFAIFE